MGSKAALYYRVSTTDQTPDAQVNALREYATKRDFDVADEFVDTASGATRKRTELDRMMAAVRKRQIDVVVVWAFDRFARSTSHLATTLEEFQSLGVDFVSYSQQIDTTTPAGKLTFHVLAAIAEFEREMIRERVISGLAAARKRGVRLGRAPLPDLVIDRVLELKGKQSIRQIAEAVSSRRNPVSRSSVQRILANGGTK